MLIVSILLLVSLFLFSGLAIAASRNRALVASHLAYAPSNDLCWQCHDINSLKSSPELSQRLTITFICGTCHSIYQARPSKSVYLGRELADVGTSALHSVYKVNPSERYTHFGHRLGSALSPNLNLISDANYQNTSQLTMVGNYLADTIKIIGRITQWSYWLSNKNFLQASAFKSQLANLPKLYCDNCHSPHLLSDAVKAINSYRLLFNMPGDSTTTEIQLISKKDWMNSGNKWCSNCHLRHGSTIYQKNGGQPRNHPDKFCLQCHGDDDDNDNDNKTQDFPHTGTINLLSNQPPKLCLFCHVSESLP